MTIKVTAKGGPLDGKTYVVHETAKQLDPHPGVTGGHYKVNEKTATWQPDKDAKPEPKTLPEPRARKLAGPKAPVPGTGDVS